MAPLTVQQAFTMAYQHHQAGRLREAEQLYRQVLAAQPGHVEALNLLGVLAAQAGKNELAVESIRQAIALRPTDAQAHGNLGNALNDSGQVDEAILAYQRAIALKPQFPEVHYNLGDALRVQGRLAEAAAACRQASALRPNFPEAYHSLATVLMEMGQIDAAIDACRQALALRPSYTEAHSNLLLALHYHPDMNASAIAEEHRQWNGQHAAPLAALIRPHANDRAPDRRLKIGYVSADFRDHVVGRFLLPLMEQHDHEKFEIICYAQVRKPDAMTQRLQALAGGWRSIVGLTNEQVAELVRQDRIDILVDLGGHTGTRLLVFAQKPAPVQVTWLGYPDTTGLSTMDYRLTDALADPPGVTDGFYTEQLVRLPETAWCFRATEDVPITPRTEGAPLTFGSCNNFAKVTEAMLEIWARVLLALPGSRLVLKAQSLADATVQARVRHVLKAAGVSAERVDLRGWDGTYAEHLASYAAVGVALDTFPYHGTTTTCEALWMGVPVVTLAGRTHVSRVGVSLLTNAGLADCVAADADEYVKIALRLAGDRERLVELRQNLRPRMETSPLMDAPRFGRQVEAAYREMWRKWCARPVPS